MKPRIYKLHCIFAFEERFWEWLRIKHYHDNKPSQDSRVRHNPKPWPCSDNTLFFPAMNRVER